ncbi:MAG: acyloxyacyl hydrolase [Alphaproteobacteria bacterium]|nr:acyloxyacyl hydrolase [Alphaproteobacteria bacterium]
MTLRMRICSSAAGGLRGTRARGARAFVLLGLLFAFVLAAAPLASARAADPAFLTFGAGIFDMNGDETTGTVSVEYQDDKRLFWEFKPMGGLMATFDGSFYVYGGVAVDLFFGRRFVLTPSFAPGLYIEGGGKDLGHIVEFRSSIELAYRLDSRARIGLELYHVSNAGLDERNPGANALMVVYSMPLGQPAR